MTDSHGRYEVARWRLIILLLTIISLTDCHSQGCSGHEKLLNASDGSGSGLMTTSDNTSTSSIVIKWFFVGAFIFFLHSFHEGNVLQRRRSSQKLTLVTKQFKSWHPSYIHSSFLQGKWWLAELLKIQTIIHFILYTNNSCYSCFSPDSARYRGASSYTPAKC